MIGLDCNILVQLAFADHAANARTIAAVQAETQRGVKLAFPPLPAETRQIKWKPLLFASSPGIPGRRHPLRGMSSATRQVPNPRPQAALT